MPFTPSPSSVDACPGVPANSGAAALSDAEFTQQLEVLARDIEHLDRKARDTMFRIAARIAKAHKLLLPRRDEGGFLGWVENRLGYSRAYAYRMLNVDRWAKSVSSWNTFGTLPVSAIYQLAAPSVSDEVRNEVGNRLKDGEKLSVAAVTEIIAKAKDTANKDEVNTATIKDGTTEGSNDEDPSIKQHRARMAALAAESEQDSAAHDDGHVDEGAGGDRGGDAGHANDLSEAAPEQTTEPLPLPISRRKKATPLEALALLLNHTCGACKRAAEWEDVPPLDAQQQAAALGKLKEAELNLRTLAARLNDDAEQEERILRDLVVEEFFARASGADIYDRIPADRRDTVMREFLDKATVDGVRKVMSTEFGEQLRKMAAAPAKAKQSAKKWKKSINHRAHERNHGFRQ
jgi:hypothetical protein